MGVLDGRVVIVTGGGRGIGRETCLIAAAEGARVLVNDLGSGMKGDDSGDAGTAEEVAALIRRSGGKAISNSESVTNYAACEAMREAALAEWGALHAVINPAGILRDTMFHKMSSEDWDAVIDVHLKGTFNICRATIDHFREQEDGAYVLFSSTSGLIGNIGQTNYGAAKMGIAGLGRILAMENATKNIRVNTIAPGAWTRMTESVPIRDEAHAKRREMMRTQMGPEKPAALAVALASPLAKDVSGQIFGASGDNISVFSQPRPVDTKTKEGGWAPTDILSACLPGLAEKFTPMTLRPPTQRASEQKAS
jgi:NAD(P)-dependent dehydrogenase (short-subunit alcohol dehydrogenase family)